ncbi:MAG TPA: hypothetical protein VKV74_09580 [Bryobacteraceae bacterium]|nr:hypothetical protein [Bryobacteraceae bacterium]
MSDAESFADHPQKGPGADRLPDGPNPTALPDIHYSDAALERIREQVWDGFRRFSRGGLEVGGILYGSRQERILTIQDVQPIACEHAFGPGFVLSQSDRSALQEQLRRNSQDPRFQDMVCLGWFLSHTRSGLKLSPGELEVYSEFFPERWQMTLLVQPETDGETRAAFFVREADGSAPASGSGREFRFPARLAASPRRREGWRQDKSTEPRIEPPLAPAPQPDPSPTSLTQLSPPQPPPVQFSPALSSATQDSTTQASAKSRSYSVADATTVARTRRVRWSWLVASGVLIVGLAVLTMRWIRADRAPQPISLALIERDGQLQIEWDRGARPVATAVRGSLEILDGQGTRRIALAPQDLAAGVLTYERKSGDVEVRMRVEEAGGGAVEEASRFLGNPPGQNAEAAEIDALTQQRDGLEVELKRLRGENAAQAERIKQLEAMLRSLEERLGVK